MKQRFARIAFRAGVTSIVAVVSSLSLFGFERLIIGVPFDTLDLLEVLFIPAVVAFPIASFIFLQSEKLQQAYDELARLHTEMEHAHRELEEASEAVGYAESHDPMTGVLNREHFLKALTSALRRRERDVFLLVDVDDFKRVNDRLGHAQGDEVLRRIAAKIPKLLRPRDQVGRVGAEEFGILLKDASPGTAADIAEEIRRSVQEIDTGAAADAAQLSVSIGGAALDDHAGGVFDILAQVEKCVSQAKLAGRNRIAFHYALSDVAFGLAKAKASKTEESR